MYNEVQLLVRNGPQVTGAEWGQGQASGRKIPYVHPLLYLYPSSTDTGKEMSKVLTHERVLSISSCH